LTDAGNMQAGDLLLAMATPMICLPVERIFKAKEGDLVADDSMLNEGLTGEVSRVLDGKLPFAEAPFARGIDWRLIRDVPPFNIAVWNASHHFDPLAREDARVAASQTRTGFMMRHIRNALAHGGIVYLDSQGRMSDRHAEMLALVSATKIEREKDGKQKIPGLHISRVSQTDFRRFLLAWADWIKKSGMAKELSENPLLAA